MNIKLLSFFIAITIAFSSCKKEPFNKISKPLIGTMINLTIGAEAKKSRAVSKAVFDEIARIESLMSPFKKSSDIYRVNRYAYKMPVTITPETFSIIEQSKRISQESGGAFDISFASLSHLWNYRSKSFKPPSKKSVLQHLPLVNYRNIKLSPEKMSVSFHKSGMKIGLGGIAKGHAIKRGIEIMKQMGISSGIVDAGGDLQVLGTKSGKNWRTGLVHPRKKTLLLALDLVDMDAIATSGDYERFAVYKNRKYHHIIDPSTGYPTRTFSSVTVISKNAIISDSYATVIFILGKKRSLSFLKKHGDLSVVLIDLDFNIYISRSLKNRIQLLEDLKVHWI
ncbi:FAD:protein FMN transferase [Spirochaetota bacterium]